MSKEPKSLKKSWSFYTENIPNAVRTGTRVCRDRLIPFLRIKVLSTSVIRYGEGGINQLFS